MRFPLGGRARARAWEGRWLGRSPPWLPIPIPILNQFYSSQLKTHERREKRERKRAGSRAHALPPLQETQWGEPRSGLGQNSEREPEYQSSAHRILERALEINFLISLLFNAHIRIIGRRREF